MYSTEPPTDASVALYTFLDLILGDHIHYNAFCLSLREPSLRDAKQWNVPERKSFY